MVITLKAARVNAGLTLDEVAKKLNKTRRTIWCWETGRTKPDFDSIKKICAIYGLTFDCIKEFA